jgi:hypothetical protein
MQSDTFRNVGSRSSKPYIYIGSYSQKNHTTTVKFRKEFPETSNFPMFVIASPKMDEFYNAQWKKICLFICITKQEYFVLIISTVDT